MSACASLHMWPVAPLTYPVGRLNWTDNENLAWRTMKSVQLLFHSHLVDGTELQIRELVCHSLHYSFNSIQIYNMRHGRLNKITQ